MRVEIGDQVFEVRGLKRGEIKALRKEGIHLDNAASANEPEKRDEELDRIFALACSGGDPDMLTPGEATDLWLEVGKETYGRKEYKKNSEPLQPSSSPEENSTAESAGPRASSPSDTARKSPEKNG